MRTETPRPFGWWWQKFLRGVPHPDDATFNEFEDMFFEPTRGFMCWMLTGGMRELFITKCCGDGAYWRSLKTRIEADCRARGVKFSVFF